MSSHARAGTVEGHITIERPIDEVFEFYRDFTNLPRFLGDVMAVEPLGASRYRWTIHGPLGIPVRWKVKVTEVRTNEHLCYETMGSPRLRTFWDVGFSRGEDVNHTTVHAVMRMPLGWLGRAALALIGKSPADEVASNLHRLKQLIETGLVTDTSHAVAGKFRRRH
jgi:uncharacterized membrane protein